MPPRVFITQPIADRAIQTLSAKGDVVWNRDSSRVLPKSDLIAAMKDTEYLFCLLHDTVDAEVIAAGPRLRMIGCMGTGVGVDLEAATRRRIPVSVGGAAVVNEATADMTWAHILAVARRVVEADRLVRAGGFPGSQSNHMLGRYVFGKTLGLIGAGRVGQAVARRAGGFSMRILYFDPRQLAPEDEARLGMTYASMEQVLAESDVVSIHALYTPETYHLIGARELARMKPTAYLINTSRGPVVDEAALVAALRERRIAGAALDVHEHEPQVNPAFIAMDNVVLTPHLGSATRQTREAMTRLVVDNILAAERGERPPNAVT